MKVEVAPDIVHSMANIIWAAVENFQNDSDPVRPSVAHEEY